jgi:hypothetical protein
MSIYLDTVYSMASHQIQCLVSHWFSTTEYTAVTIIQHLCGIPYSAYREDADYIIIHTTSLTCPRSIFSKAQLCQSTTQHNLIWHLIHCGQCALPAMYAFILAQPSCSKLRPLQTRIGNSIYTDNNTTQALSAKRPDLQHIVLAGYRILLAVWRTPELVETALHSALHTEEHPYWQLRFESPFYTCVKQCLHRASIAFICRPIQKHGTPRTLARIEGDINLDLLNRDQYLLVYLLTFATEYSQYLLQPPSQSTQLQFGIPPALCDFWRAISRTNTFTNTPL